MVDKLVEFSYSFLILEMYILQFLSNYKFQSLSRDFLFADTYCYKKLGLVVNGPYCLGSLSRKTHPL